MVWFKFAFESYSIYLTVNLTSGVHATNGQRNKRQAYHGNRTNPRLHADSVASTHHGPRCDRENFVRHQKYKFYLIISIYQTPFYDLFNCLLATNTLRWAMYDISIMFRFPHLWFLRSNNELTFMGSVRKAMSMSCKYIPIFALKNENKKRYFISYSFFI